MISGAPSRTSANLHQRSPILEIRTPRAVIDYGDKEQAIRRRADDALVRDKLAKQISAMTFEEEQAYLRKRLCDEST